jgi:hypothetical protein
MFLLFRIIKFHIVIYNSTSDTMGQMSSVVWFYDRCLFLITNQTIDQADVRLGWHRSHCLYLYNAILTCEFSSSESHNKNAPKRTISI